jgi:hypothetical protein
MDFPMPNLAYQGRIVVASCWYTDEPQEIALVLMLEPESPFFTVAHIALDDGEILGMERHMNIVHAVKAYEDWGGDV